MAEANGSSWETSDLGTAAYVHMRGLKILGTRRVGGRFVFSFSDPESQAAQFQVDYLNSNCRKFDAAVRSLKKLCYDGDQSKSSGSRRRCLS